MTAILQASSHQNGLTRRSGPLITLGLGAWLVAFTAIIPTDYDKPLWALSVLLVLGSAIARRDRLAMMWLPLPILAFQGWVALSVFWSVERSKTFVELVIATLVTLFGLFVGANRPLRDLLRLTAIGAATLLMVCWIVAVLIPSVGISSENERSGVVQGLFRDKNAFGYFSLLSLITLCCLTAGRPQRRRLRPALGALLAFVSMLASGSRTAWSVAVAIVLLSLMLFGISRARRPLAVPMLGWALVVTVAGWFVASNWTELLNLLGRDPTLTNRTRIWSITLGAIEARPVTGYGWQALWLDDSPTTLALWAQNYHVPFYHAHNGYLDITANLGVVGLVLATVVFAHLLVRAVASFLRAPSALAAWPILVVLMVLIYQSTEVVAFANTTWLLIVALTAVLDQERRLACTSPTHFAS